MTRYCIVYWDSRNSSWEPLMDTGPRWSCWLTFTSKEKAEKELEHLSQLYSTKCQVVEVEFPLPE